MSTSNKQETGAATAAAAKPATAARAEAPAAAEAVKKAAVIKTDQAAETQIRFVSRRVWPD